MLPNYSQYRWFEHGNYASDGKYMLRFDAYGNLVSRQKVENPWLSNWGTKNFDTIKNHY